jgi:hypothetical protein
MLCVRFNDRQRGVPRMSSALLVRRLKEFQFAGIVERRRNLAAVFEYHLTSAGRELFPVVEKMGPGAQRWLRHDLVDTANLDPFLIWDIRRNVVGAVSAARSPVRSPNPAIRRANQPTPLLAGVRARLCRSLYRNPGFDVDLFVVARAHTDLARPLPDRPSRPHGKLRFDGSRGDVAAFPLVVRAQHVRLGGPRFSLKLCGRS